jgi:hypothetical protein
LGLELELSMARGNVEALRELNAAMSQIKQILENADGRYKYDSLVRIKLEYVLKKLERVYDIVSYLHD